MRRIQLMLLFGAIFISFLTEAQETGTAQESGLDGGSIESQFDYINTVSTNYQEYKVVRRTHLSKLQSNIADSLNAYRNEISGIQKQLDEQNRQMEQINANMSQANQELEDAIEQRDSFYFLGTYIHKSVYNNLVWGIIIVLVLVLVISYFRFKQSHQVRAETEKRLHEIQEEFEQHRRNTLERERKLNRQLVDALNKK
jgi:preprotein translocase subunit SecF